MCTGCFNVNVYVLFPRPARGGDDGQHHCIAAQGQGRDRRPAAGQITQEASWHSNGASRQCSAGTDHPTNPPPQEVRGIPVTAAGNGSGGITIATLTAALALATVSGGFSVYGMTSIFTGALWPVIGMGAALELGKLSAVAWLGHRHGSGCLLDPVAVLLLLAATRVL
jgi:hypothetical protein